MTEDFFFTVFGHPVAQGRPRFFRRGNGVGVYDPPKSKSWKEEVRRSAIKSGALIMDGALSMTLEFQLARPKSLPKKVRHHTRKPDLDNLVKAVLDGLRGICFKDDSNLVSLSAMKSYSLDIYGVKVTIRKTKEE